MSDQPIPLDLEAARAAVLGGKSLAEHIGLSPHIVRLLYVTALGHYEAGRHEQAVDDLQKLLALDARHADGWALMGNSLLRVGKFVEALDAWTLALYLKPSFGSAHQVARTALALKNLETACIAVVAMGKHASTPEHLAALAQAAQTLTSLAPSTSPQASVRPAANATPN